MPPRNCKIWDKTSKSGLHEFIYRIAVNVFSVEISYAITEIEKRIELQQFLRIDNIPTPNGVYRFMSQFSAEQFISMTHGIIETEKNFTQRR